MKIPIVLFGAGAHAYVVIDIIEQMNQYKIVGLVDSKLDLNAEFDGYKIIGRQEDILELIEQYGIRGGIVCIGDNYWRGFVVDEIKKKTSEFLFINAIHPSVQIGKNVKFGEGNVFDAWRNS